MTEEKQMEYLKLGQDYYESLDGFLPSEAFKSVLVVFANLMLKYGLNLQVTDEFVVKVYRHLMKEFELAGLVEK